MEHPVAQKILGLINEQGTKNDERRTLLAKILTSMYFLNVWFTNIQTWLFFSSPFPWISIFLILPVIGLLIGKYPKIMACLLMADIVKDNAFLLMGVVHTYMYSNT